MKLGVLTVLLGDLPFEEALDYLRDLGIQSVEIGCGNYPGNAHCDPDKLLHDDEACDAFLNAVTSRDMDICALAAHGNPLHPNPKIARAHIETQRKAIQLAHKLGVETVVGFSGCPGDSEGSKFPNWVTCPWPGDYLEILEWQWEQKVIPYWKEEADFLREHNARIALEMHPGFVVYNSETCLQLRDACGPEIGANLDPSHLFWQGCDIIAVIRELGQGRRALPLPRQGYQGASAERRPSTACWTPSPIPMSSTAPGSSAAWATATTPAIGKTS